MIELYTDEELKLRKQLRMLQIFAFISASLSAFALGALIGYCVRSVLIAEWKYLIEIVCCLSSLAVNVWIYFLEKKAFKIISRRAFYPYDFYHFIRRIKS